ncbi:MAG TPA: hypothetical protein VEX11_00585, partial [Acetobacteraceae bacterium]|nr:hypothetical protein [Acetobacteraceae bacterium]
MRAGEVGRRVAARQLEEGHLGGAQGERRGRRDLCRRLGRRRAHRRLVGQQPRDEAEAFQLLARHAGPGQHQASRGGEADHVHQLGDVLQPVGEAEPHGGDAHPGIGGGEAEVALQGEFQPGAEAVA